LRRESGLAQRHLRQPPADRQPGARERRRAPDRQVPADLRPAMSATLGAGTRMIRIGEVVRRLSEKFPDISISKIRFLEDEGLLTPQRTPGGYRLFSEDDLDRLTTTLRLQRDEFLPLRAIRDALSAPGVVQRKRRRPTRTSPRLAEIDL